MRASSLVMQIIFCEINAHLHRRGSRELQGENSRAYDKSQSERGLLEQWGKFSRLSFTNNNSALIVFYPYVMRERLRYMTVISRRFRLVLNLI